MAKFREARRLVRVDHQRLRFAAAHMATFGGAIEPLHGHNYAVTIEVEGDLDVDDGWVVDFGVLKRIGSAICERLDHHFLLQCESKALHMSRQAGVWELSFGTKRYLLPADDVFELPVTNTTTEQIAGWFWHEVDEGLRSRSIRTVSHLAVGVEEAPGQAGWFTAATT